MHDTFQMQCASPRLTSVRPDRVRVAMQLRPTPQAVQSHSAPISTIRLFVADPHAIVRAGVKTLVEAQPDMRVIGEAAAGPDALRLAAELNPDVVVLEVSLPGLDGAQVAARLREDRPDQKVLVLTGCEDKGSLGLLLGVGARGYILKRATAEELVGAIRAVASGGTYIDPLVFGAVGRLTGPQADADTQDTELSERERDVVRRIALGYSNKEIAARLKVSVKTVETYKSRALEKLGIRSRVEIVRFAAKHGWLHDAEDSRDQSAPLFAADSTSSK